MCVYGHHEFDYPRNRLNIMLIEKCGWKVIHCHSRISFPFRHISLLWQLVLCIQKVQLVYITEGGHRLVPLAKAICILFRRKIIFDPFISRYNTRVQDRKLYSEKHLQAFICKWQDWSACKCSDFLFFDTYEHKEYFYSNYKLKVPWAILPVMVDETVFRMKEMSVKRNEEFHVLFYGTYIPLHGIQYILEAAKFLKPYEYVKISLIGNGQEYNNMISLSKELFLDNVTFMDIMDYAELVEHIKLADVCLGIFDDGIKASQVVPNKIVQCAAMGKCIITRESNAIKRFFDHKKNILLVKEANSKHLSDTILELSNNVKLVQTIGRESRKLFEQKFSMDSLKQEIEEVLEQISSH